MHQVTDYLHSGDSMKEKTGRIFSIAKDNTAPAGCTVSKTVREGMNRILYFSLAANTDISAEIFPYYKLLIVADGRMEVCGKGGDRKELNTGDSILTSADTPVGMKTEAGSVYTEIEIRRSDIMNEAIRVGEVFRLSKLVPYEEGKIVNMDVVHNDTMKLVVMAFDEGTGLSEHAAPGEELIFALDGEAIIGYEGKNHPIRAGENFHFAKGGLHSVKASKRFKMALLLTLE